MDGISTCGPKEEVTLRVVVRMPPQHIIKGVRDFREGQCRKQHDTESHGFALLQKQCVFGRNCTCILSFDLSLG